jgi:dephospho-CoA kinase
MVNSKTIKQELIALLGEEAYSNGVLNKTYISNIIFNDKTYLNKINAIVHPRVAAHFKTWAASHNTPYVIKEVAILFETVTAPKALRISRVIKRDQTTKAKVEAIMSNQWDDSKKIERSDFVIYNEELENAKSQIAQIHSQILSKND